MKKFNSLHLFSPRHSSGTLGSTLGLSKTFLQFLTVALVVFALTACGDKDKDSATPNTPVAPVSPDPDQPDEPTPDEPVTVARMVGEWKLTEWTVDSRFVDHIYLEILDDGTFALYEDITSHGFNKMTGTFTFNADEETISGSYSDGKAWGSSYTVAMPSTRTMRWTAIGTEDTCVYTRADIPADIVRTSRATPTDEVLRFL